MTRRGGFGSPTLRQERRRSPRIAAPRSLPSLNTGEATTGPGWGACVALALLFGLAAGLQSSVAGRMAIFGGAPDFLLTLTLTAALVADAGAGAIIGFFGGLIAAAVAGQTVGTYIATRTFSAWQAAWITGRFIESRGWVVVLGVALGTLATEVLYILGYPHLRIGVWVRATLVSAALNALLSLPVYFLLRRIGWRKSIG